MQVKSIAECSKGSISAILSTYIKLPFAIKIFVLPIFEWPFCTGFTVYNTELWCGASMPMFFQGEYTMFSVDSTVLLTLFLIETPFNAFANRADPDQAALVRAA